MSQDALRNWRRAGEYEKALPHAGGDTKADLQWMIQSEKLMQLRPADIQNRLTAAERKRLAKATRMPTRRRRPVAGHGRRGSPKSARSRGGGYAG